MLTGGDFGCAARWWGSVPMLLLVVRRGVAEGGVGWRHIRRGGAGRGWVRKVARRRRVVWCPSVPDVWVRCPMLTGGDFGCAAGWWGAVAKFGALFGGAAADLAEWRGGRAAGRRYGGGTRRGWVAGAVTLWNGAQSWRTGL